MDKPAAAIILAAGGSRRFGSPKQLLKWKRQYLINRVISLANQACLDPVVVVLGSDYEIIKKKIRANKQVKLIHNIDWEIGQSTSLIAATKEIQPMNIPFVILLCDQPQLNVNNVTNIIDLYYKNSCDVVITAIENNLIPPVIFSPACIPGILRLKGDRGARSIVNEYKYCTYKEQDKRLLMDIDTPQDFEKIKILYEMRVAI